MVSLVPILILFFFVLLFGAGMIGVNHLLSIKAGSTAVKKEAYECGVEGQFTGHTKVPVKYYLTAILFILFDIEIIFMYPWAITYVDFLEAGHGAYILGAMGVFLAIFIFGLFWEIKSKALEWE